MHALWPSCLDKAREGVDVHQLHVHDPAVASFHNDAMGILVEADTQGEGVSDEAAGGGDKALRGF